MSGASSRHITKLKQSIILRCLWFKCRCRDPWMRENTEYIFRLAMLGRGAINKDPMVCLDGARPPPKVVVNFVKSNNDFGKIIK